jgi:hypothetical protein
MSQFKSPSHKLLFSARQGREKWKQKAMSNRDKLRNEELKKKYHHDRSIAQREIIKAQASEIETLRAEIEKLKKSLLS